MVYCGSNIFGNVVIQYDLESGDWREIPTPLEAFALASFNNQLVLAGGRDSDSIEDSTIRVWDSERGAVVDSSYPPMLAGRGASGVRELSYEKLFSIVSNECPEEKQIDTCCCKSSENVKFYKLEPKCIADPATYEMKFTFMWNEVCHA